jgi:hypothetical protein
VVANEGKKISFNKLLCENANRLFLFNNGGWKEREKIEIHFDHDEA